MEVDRLVMRRTHDRAKAGMISSTQMRTCHYQSGTSWEISEVTSRHRFQ
jgi:hypothetical protein